MRKTILTLLFGCSLMFCLVGCGNSKNTSSTSGNNKPINNNTEESVAENVTDNVGDAMEDVADGAGDVVNDVADSVGNVVEDLVGNNGFNNYVDAHDYFLKTMGSYHSDADFEIRDENRDLFDYQEGSKGYRFSLYDKSKKKDGELFGEFYVDANNGRIYKADSNGSVSEYPTRINSKDVSHKNNKANKNNKENKNKNRTHSSNNARK